MGTYLQQKKNVFVTLSIKCFPLQLKHSWSLAWKCLFLWGYLKTRVFQANPTTAIQALKQWISDEFAAIPGNMLQQVMGNFLLLLSDQAPSMPYMQWKTFGRRSIRKEMLYHKWLFLYFLVNYYCMVEDWIIIFGLLKNIYIFNKPMNLFYYPVSLNDPVYYVIRNNILNARAVYKTFSTVGNRSKGRLTFKTVVFSVF